MADGFAAAARRMAGLSARALGWTPDLFWNATPAELVASLMPEPSIDAPLTRAQIDRMMEQDHDD